EIIHVEKTIPKNLWCLGTVQINSADAERLGIKMGDLIIIENPLGRKVLSKAYVCETVRPGVIRMGFATGGRFSPGLGGTYAHRTYTPNHSELLDYIMSPIMGQPIFADMIVKVRKATPEETREIIAEYYRREWKII
ncbi:MAG: molybdopterin dinucleotide binding domain-containing protein, partial [Nitrososphaerota archaeon]